MMDIITLEQLGGAEHGWLSARHHFSFADYMDPSRMGLGPLRVWNDDLIRAGTGFPMHPHRDMEIITYIRRGAITHEDSLGNKGRTIAGDIQVMSAGTGIVHSEYNLENEDTTLFQIWIYPDRRGYAPRWETRQFPAAERDASLTVLASGRDQDRDSDALTIHQDAALLAASLQPGQQVIHDLPEGRAVYMVPARGQVRLNGTAIAERSGVAVTGSPALEIEAVGDAEIVLVDIPFPWDVRSVVSG